MRTILLLLISIAQLSGAEQTKTSFDKGIFYWKASQPLIDVGDGKTADDPHVSLKDPSFVFAEGKWHLFTTVRMKSGKVDMEYLAFTNWTNANSAPRTVLNLHNQYNCAPQVFYFKPHQKWYLIYQLADTNRAQQFGPYFSTTSTIGEPKSWTQPEPMIPSATNKPKWLDFWIICDETKAHMFYTSLDGNLWRRETPKSRFPVGWSEQKLALSGDIFEASHTYKIKGRRQYLTIIEAQGDRRRYYQAYVADRLDGEWRPLAASRETPFASYENIEQTPLWTGSISHGELFREGNSEFMVVDATRLRFLFQGASDSEYRNNPYGRIPWQLGILEAL